MPKPEPGERLVLPQGVLLSKAMEILWSCEGQTVWDVVHKLDKKLGLTLHYQTISTILIRLCRMGLVTRVRTPTSKSYIYSALTSREEAEKAEISKAVRVLFGVCQDPHVALSYLVRIVENSGSELLAEMETLVRQRRQEPRSEDKT